MADSVGNVKIPARRLMANVVVDVKITGLRVALWRMWLATQIIKLACWVAGCKYRIDKGETDDKAS